MDDRTRTLSSSHRDALGTDDCSGTAPPGAREPPAMPDRVDRYELLGVLGRGGMGTVYAAHDPQLDRKVALKLLDTLHETERLRREARALASLSHENVVRIFDVGTDEGRLYVVMEIIEGWTLREWLARVPRPPWTEAVRVLQAAGRGLAAAHALGLVHRDFKPGNVLIGHDGRVCVVDFGLARAAEGEHPSETGRRDASMLSTLDATLDATRLQAQITETGAVVGTPAYMAPEQWLGHAVDRRTDVFGFCVTAWEAVYGVRPFVGESAREVALRIVHGVIDDPPAGSGVPAWLHAALRRGLHADPAERHPSMEAVLEALAGPPARRRRGLVVGATAGALAVTAAAVLIPMLGQESRSCAAMSAPMDELWTPARRAAIAAAMQGAGPSYARAAWERIEPTLDAYAGAWALARTRACEARREGEAVPQTERIFDLRMQCLEHRRIALATLLDVLEASEPATIEAGASLAWRLPAIADCDDLDGLERREDRPDDPAARDAVDGARSRLARTRVLVDAGHYAEALADTEALLAEAERLGWPPLAAEVGLVRGIALVHEGRLDEGEQLLDRALLDAVAARRDDLAIEAALDRAYALAEGGRLDEAAAMVTRAEGMWRSAGEPDRQGVRLLEVSAQLALRRGEYPEARRLLEQGVQRERTLGDDGPNLADSLANLSLIEQLMGELEAAQAHCSEALAIRERTQGPEHPDLALDLHNLAVTYAMQGRFDEAEPRFERSLAIKLATLGPEHPAVAASLTALGNVAMERGRPADAERRFEEAVALLERAHGPEHPELYYPVFGLAQIHFDRDPPAGARELLRRSIALLETTAGPTHPELAAPLRRLGELELREGHPAEALALLRRSVELSAGIVEDPLEAAELRLLLARALWDGGGDRAEAVELLRGVLKGLPDSGDPEHQRVRADLERWLAEHPPPA